MSNFRLLRALAAAFCVARLRLQRGGYAPFACNAFP